MNLGEGISVGIFPFSPTFSNHVSTLSEPRFCVPLQLIGNGMELLTSRYISI